MSSSSTEGGAVGNPGSSNNNNNSLGWQSKVATSVHGAFQRAGSALVSGLRSCDDAVATADTANELRVGQRVSSERYDTRNEWGQETIIPAKSKEARSHTEMRRHTLTTPASKDDIFKKGATETWGSNSFKFSLSLEGGGGGSRNVGGPENNQNGRERGSVTPQSNSECIVACARDKSTGAELPLRCSWKRKVGGVTFAVHEQKGARYVLTADDVSSTVMVEATIPGQPEKGTAFGECGPFDLDCGLRRSLESYLRLGGTRFSVQSVDVSEPGTAGGDTDATNGAGGGAGGERCNGGDMALHVSDDCIKLIKPGPNNIGFVREWKMATSADVMIAHVKLLAPTEFTLTFEDSSSSSSGSGWGVGKSQRSVITLSALTRKQRDLIALSIRCFQAKSFVKTSLLLEQVAKKTSEVSQRMEKQSPPLETMMSSENVDESGKSISEERTSLDLFLVINQLARQLMSSLTIAEKAAMERTRAVTERDALESDMDACIEFYKRMLAEQQENAHLDGTSSKSVDPSAKGNTNASALDLADRAAQIASLRVEVSEAREQARKYLEDLELLRRDHRALQNKVSEKESEVRLLMLGGSTRKNDSVFDFDQNERNSMTNARVAELERHLKQLSDLNVTLETKNHLKESKIKEMQENLSRIDETMQSKMISAKSASKQETENYKKLQDETLKLKNQNTSLARKIEELEFERGEVEKNFLYVKAQFEDLKKRQQSGNSFSQNKISNNSQASIDNTSAVVEQYRMQILALQDTLMEKDNQCVKGMTETSKLEQTNKDLTRKMREMETDLKRANDSKLKVEQTFNSMKSIEKSTKGIPRDVMEMAERLSVSFPVSQNDFSKLVRTIDRKEEDLKKLNERYNDLEDKCRRLAMISGSSIGPSESLDSSVRY